jgi:excisionase family DNA binding protein
VVDPDEEERGLKVAEAARRLGVGVTKMRQLIDQDLVRSWRVPGSTHRRVSPSDLERLRAEMLGHVPKHDEPADGGADPPVAQA